MIDNPRMLRTFVQIVRSGAVGRKSLGTRPRRLIRNWLAERTDEQKAELLVLATHGRRGISRMIKGSVAESVARYAKVPVLCLPVPKNLPG